MQSFQDVLLVLLDNSIEEASFKQLARSSRSALVRLGPKGSSCFFFLVSNCTHSTGQTAVAHTRNFRPLVCSIRNVGVVPWPAPFWTQPIRDHCKGPINSIRVVGNLNTNLVMSIRESCRLLFSIQGTYILLILLILILLYYVSSLLNVVHVHMRCRQGQLLGHPTAKPCLESPAQRI